jgi:hypothetical protein
LIIKVIIHNDTNESFKFFLSFDIRYFLILTEVDLDQTDRMKILRDGTYILATGVSGDFRPECRNASLACAPLVLAEDEAEAQPVFLPAKRILLHQELRSGPLCVVCSTEMTRAELLSDRMEPECRPDISLKIWRWRKTASQQPVVLIAELCPWMQAARCPLRSLAWIRSSTQ